MRVLLLTLDAYGGIGGIAQFNRDFVQAVCTHPACEQVTIMPRHMPRAPEAIPAKATCVTGGLGSKTRYVMEAVRRGILTGDHDLLVCGHINLLPLACLVKWCRRRPLLLQLHGVEVWSPAPAWTARMLAAVDAVMSVSQVTLDRFQSWAKLNHIACSVVPNTVNLRCYSPRPKNAELCRQLDLEGKTVLLTVSRLPGAERYKGIDEVLDVLPRLLLEDPSLRYLIVGDGDDRARLQAKARRLNLDRHVHFSGYVSESTKVAYYSLADAFVMPGRCEGFGIVYLEAMACGIPVVASKVDGSREAVRDGVLGVLVDPGDPDDLYRGIKAALAKPRGVVPDGLEYFSVANFDRRVHRTVNKIIGERGLA